MAEILQLNSEPNEYFNDIIREEEKKFIQYAKRIKETNKKCGCRTEFAIYSLLCAILVSEESFRTNGKIKFEYQRGRYDTIKLLTKTIEKAFASDLTEAEEQYNQVWKERIDNAIKNGVF